jgi:hypothetical protein
MAIPLKRKIDPPVAFSLIRSTTIFFCAYFLLLLFVAMPHGFATEYLLFGGGSPPVYPLSTNKEMQDIMGSSDAGSYARGGAELAQNGWNHLGSYIPLWPPGMFVIHASDCVSLGQGR